MANNEYKMVADYNLWRVGNKDKDIWAIHNDKGEFLFDVLGDDYEEMLDLDLVEDGYMTKPHTNEELLAYQKRWGILWTDKQPEQRSVWIRVGVTVTGTKEQMEKLFDGDEETLRNLIERKQYELDGNAYIPDLSVESYNDVYGTNYAGEIDFEL